MDKSLFILIPLFSTTYNWPPHLGTFQNQKRKEIIPLNFYNHNCRGADCMTDYRQVRPRYLNGGNPISFSGRWRGGGGRGRTFPSPAKNHWEYWKQPNRLRRKYNSRTGNTSCTSRYEGNSATKTKKENQNSRKQLNRNNIQISQTSSLVSFSVGFKCLKTAHGTVKFIVTPSLMGKCPGVWIDASLSTWDGLGNRTPSWKLRRVQCDPEKQGHVWNASTNLQGKDEQRRGWCCS